MLKKWMILPIAAGLLAVNAGAAVSDNYAPGSDDNNSKCYWISTADDLDDFSNNVVNKGKLDACAKLQNDIYYQGENVKVLNNAGNAVNTAPAGGWRKWNPIGMDASGTHFPFMGTFDGNKKTIYGLFCEQNWEPSFIAKAQGGAVIKNLVIADSYFHVTNSTGATNNAGDGAGFIGDVPHVGNNSADVTLDRCGFSGLVYAERRADKDGGLVGSVGAGASLVITNSYNEGVVTGTTSNTRPKYMGGLVGYVNNGSHLEMTNCYNAGTATTDPIIGGKDSKAGNISGVDVGCVNASKCGSVFPVTNTNGNTVFANSNPDEVVANYNKLLGDADYQADNVLSNFGAEMLTETLVETGTVSGITFEDEETGCDMNSKDCKPTTAVATIKTEIKEDEIIRIGTTVKIGGVKFDRVFKSGVLSSIVLPFSIKAGNVTNATFYTFEGVDEENWTIAPVSVGSEETIEANKPYYVMKKTAGEGNLTFEGGVTLVSTDGASLETRVGNWVFKGMYGYHKWEEGDPELGHIFGQAAKDASDERYHAGDFIKIGKNSYIKAMRAYLSYVPQNIVGAKRMALAKITAELPSVIRVTPIEKPESTVESVLGTDEETLGIINSPKAPAHMLVKDRWFDMKGRSMNGKPQSKGAFINNSTPVVVK